MNCPGHFLWSLWRGSAQKPPSDEGGGFAAGEDRGREIHSRRVVDQRKHLSPRQKSEISASPLDRGGLLARCKTVRYTIPRAFAVEKLSAKLTEGEILNSEINLFAYTAKVTINIQIADSQYR